jgi:hypothetical protein
VELLQRDLDGVFDVDDTPILIGLISIVLRSVGRVVIGAATMKSISPSGNISLR